MNTLRGQYTVNHGTFCESTANVHFNVHFKVIVACDRETAVSDFFVMTRYVDVCSIILKYIDMDLYLMSFYKPRSFVTSGNEGKKV